MRYRAPLNTALVGLLLSPVAMAQTPPQSPVTASPQTTSDAQPPNSSRTLIAYSYAALEIFKFARTRGWRTILGQIDPGPPEARIVADRIPVGIALEIGIDRRVDAIALGLQIILGDLFEQVILHHVDEIRRFAPGDRGAHDLLRVIRRNYLPNKVVLRADGAEGQTWLTEQVEAIRQMHPVDGKSAAYVCRNFACELPVTESEMLEEQLRVRKLRGKS